MLARLAALAVERALVPIIVATQVAVVVPSVGCRLVVEHGKLAHCRAAALMKVKENDRLVGMHLDAPGATVRSARSSSRVVDSCLFSWCVDVDSCTRASNSRRSCGSMWLINGICRI